jgi:hypothetical protein
LILPYFNMLSTKKSAQTPVFIAFFPFITTPTAKSGLKTTVILLFCVQIKHR